MLAQGALTIAIGVGAGLLGSAALTRFLATMLFEIAPTDPIIFCALARVTGRGGSIRRVCWTSIETKGRSAEGERFVGLR